MAPTRITLLRTIYKLREKYPVSVHRFVSVLVKEYRHILREPRTLWMVFLSPAFVLITLSGIFSSGSGRVTLLLLTIPFILVQIGWGTLISLISHTQQQAILFFFALAMLEVALSRFMVPANNLPGVMRVLSYVSSVRHYTVILRGIMVRGTGFGALWLPSLALCGIALAVTVLAWVRLRSES